MLENYDIGNDKSAEYIFQIYKNKINIIIYFNLSQVLILLCIKSFQFFPFRLFRKYKLIDILSESTAELFHFK